MTRAESSDASAPIRTPIAPVAFGGVGRVRQGQDVIGLGRRLLNRTPPHPRRRTSQAAASQAAASQAAADPRPRRDPRRRHPRRLRDPREQPVPGGRLVPGSCLVRGGRGLRLGGGLRGLVRRVRRQSRRLSGPSAASFSSSGERQAVRVAQAWAATSQASAALPSLFGAVPAVRLPVRHRGVLRRLGAGGLDVDLHGRGPALFVHDDLEAVSSDWR